MTTEIIFDGQYLRYNDQNGIERKIPAISGRPGYINPTTENVQLRDVGPIPEGTYNFGEQQSIDPVDSVIGITSSIIRNIGSRAGLDIKFGEWPGGSIAWGNERVWLHPEESTETFGRTNFSIHGGDEPGSAGCIDLMHNKEFFDFFRSQGDNVRLVVNYSNYDGSHNPLVSQYLDNQWQIQLPYVQSQIDQAISDGAYDQLQRQELMSYYERVFKTYVRDRAGFNDMTIERGNDGNINARITGGNLLDHIANQNSNLASLIIHSAGGGGNDSNSQSISSIHITDENNNNITYQVRPGDHVNNLINSNIIDQHTTLNSHYLNNDQDNDCLFTVTSNNQTHTVVQDNINVTLIDGTIVPISSLIDMHLEANAALVDYNTSDYSFILDSLKDPQLISGWMIEIANGVAAHQSVEEIAKIIAIRTIVNQTMDRVSNATLNLYFTNEERQIANDAFSRALANNQSVDQALSNIGSDAVSQETASKIDLLQQSNGFQIAYGAVKAFAVAALIHHDDGLDRQEYGQLAVQVVATTAANTFVTDYFAKQGSGAAGAGVGAFVVAMVSAGVNDMFADDHMNSRQWQNTTINAAALGAAAAAGYFIAAGTAVGGPVGAAVAGMVLALSGGLIGGPEYGPGEYPAPYDFLRIVPKADGTGNEIYGLVREGVVAIASEYGDDDIYGTPGQDILIGKEGKNIVFGYDGSDHIEGRGNEDKLFGGNDNDNISGGSGNDYIAGGDGDDVIAGDEGDDQILAGNGNDLVKGGQGDDQIEAEDGDDIVYGGIGNDVVLGGRGNDIIFGDEGDDVIYSEDGDDLLIGGDGNDIISGGDGNDNVSGGIGNDNIKGDNGDDIIYGNSGNDTIHGDAGNDQIQGGQGDDLIFGGIGNDIISGGSDNDQILGEIGDDYLMGDDGDDVISGGGGNDVIYGGQGVDHLKGGDGDDLFLFKIGDGQDVIDDGDVSGNDVIKLVDINSNQIILSKNNQDLIIQFKDSQGNLTSDQITVKNQFNNDNSLNTIIDNIELADNQKILLSDIVINPDNNITYQLISYDNQVSSGQLAVVENYQSLTIAESQITNPYSSFWEINYNTVDNANHIDNEYFNNVQQICERRRESGILGTGIGADGYTVCHEHREPNLNGNNTNNRIIGNSWGETIRGNNGNDDLIGNNGNDSIYGGNGNDLISGGNNNDRLFGEEGNDRIYGGENEDYIEGNNGNDDLFGDNGDDQILGGNGDDLIDGGNGHDNLRGGIDNDIIYGGSGNDSIFGDEGDDLIDGGDGHDYIEGGLGNDTIYGGAGNDAIHGQVGNDQIDGGDGDDQIWGGDGANIILGGAGNDMIYSLDNDDKIYGGDGNDIIWGGGGNNIIAGGNDNDAIYTGNGNDQIDGGNGEDHIEAGDGDDIISGGAGNDNIHGQVGNDQIDGGDGDDQIWGNSGANMILGGNGDDRIYTEEGDDQIDGGAGNNHIEAGNGNNIINTGLGNDTIYAGDGNDQIHSNYGDDIIFAGNGNNNVYGGDGNDQINTGNGFDNIEAGAGNDIVYSGDNNDIIDGGQGDDIINAGAGSDILIDDYGSNIFDLGFDEDADILNIAQVTSESHSINIINNFDPIQDRIILKIDYQNPINFYNIWQSMVQNGSNTEVSLANGQQIILNNIDKSLINANNFTIALTDIAQNKILFATNGNSIVLGDNGNNNNENSDFVKMMYSFYYSNQSLKDFELVNTGPDIFYDKDANNIFRYQIDSKFFGDVKETIIDNDGFNPQSTITNASHHIDDDIAFKSSNQELELHYAIKHYFAKNFYNQQEVIIDGYNRSFGVYYGAEGVSNTLLMTEGNDALALEDNTSPIVSNDIRMKNISVIYAGGGNDLINLTSPNYRYQDIVIYGGNGDDQIWSSVGNDHLFGQLGNDEIFGGQGDDIIDGGDGDDYIDGGAGADIISGGKGNDIFYFDNFKNHGQNHGEIDIITDFIQNEDKIKLLPGYFNHLNVASQESKDSDDNSGLDVHYDQAGDTIISSRYSDYQIKLIGHINLSNDDFIFDGSANVGDGIIYGSSIDDQIVASAGNNFINAGDGDDYIEASAGNDTINGGFGNDTINGAAGNDILIDDYGSNIFDGGDGADILIMTQTLDQKNSINTINNFDPNQDHIILKVDYKNPINFYDIWQSMTQNGNDAEINLIGGQKIIISNIDKSLITASNFIIALTDIAQNKILFATNANLTEVIEVIYGENHNRLSNIGPDALYLGNNSNILKYQVDSKYFGDSKETMVDFTHYLIDGNIDSRNIANENQLIHSCLANGNLFSIFSSGPIEDNFKPQLITDHTRYYSDDDVAFRHDVKEHSSYYTLENNTTEYWFTTLYQHYLTNHFNYAIKHYFTKNFYTTHDTIIDGYNRSFGSYDGSSGNNTLIMTEGNDMLALEDKTSPIISDGPRVKNMSVIYAGGGDDLINFSSPNYSHGDINIYGGDGNDKIWSSIGNDHLFGQSGNDEIYGGSGDDKIDGGDGDDFISGGAGNNILTGGWGNDIFCFDSFENDDRELIHHNDNEIDVITDFTQNEDKIRITNPNFDHIIYAGDGENQNVDSTGLEYHFDESGNTIIDDHFEFIIKLSGHIELNNGDFIFGA